MRDVTIDENSWKIIFGFCFRKWHSVIVPKYCQYGFIGRNRLSNRCIRFSEPRSQMKSQQTHFSPKNVKRFSCIRWTHNYSSLIEFSMFVYYNKFRIFRAEWIENWEFQNKRTNKNRAFQKRERDENSNKKERETVSVAILGISK